MNYRNRIIAAYLMILFITFFNSSQLSAENQNAAEGEYPTVSRWPDESPIRPLKFSEWREASRLPQQFEAESLYRKDGISGEKSTGYICVIINRELYYQTVSAVTRFVDDLTIDGYSVELILSLGGEPHELRQLLVDKYAQGLVGAILIGDLPIAWYEITCFFGEPYGTYEEWPCDLYYMDLDGVWNDNDSDGLFDYHGGHKMPEIWIGRLTPSPLTHGTSSEADLLENYLYKNHQYRQGNMPLANKALFYTDDDWSPSNYLADIIEGVYENITHVHDYYETNADNYRETIAKPFEFIHVNAHSDPHSHYFSVPNASTRTVSYSNIIEIDPPAAFYNLYACSNIRYTDNNYMGGWYIFKSKYGLGAVGSTKTGSMLSDQHFYSHLAADSSLGEAFRQWFYVVVENEWSDIICWFYGMCLCGDPTLNVQRSSNIEIVDVAFSDEALGNGNQVFEQNETFTTDITLMSNGSKTARTVSVRVFSGDERLVFSDNVIDVGDIDTSFTAQITLPPVSIYIPPDYVPSITDVFIELIYNDSGIYDTTAYSLSVGTPTVLLVDDDDGDDIEKYYRMYFDNNNVPVDIWDAATTPPESVLNSYETVFWFTGDYRTYPLDSNEIAVMKSFMDNGGNFVLSGQGIAAQLDLYTDADFLNNYLKADYLSTSYVPLVIGEPGAPVLGTITDTASLQGNLGANNQTDPDHINPINGGVAELRYFMADDYGAVSYNGDYKLFFASFGLEAVSIIDPRWLISDTLMAHLMVFFQFEYPLAQPNVESIAISPGDVEMMFDHHPLISWSYSDPNGLPQNLYQVRVSGTGYQNNLLFHDSGPLSGSTSEYLYPDDNLQDGDTYSVLVRVFNGSRWSEWGWRFVHYNSIPCPAYFDPSGGEIVFDTQLTLCHDNALDEEGSSVSFSCELYSDSLLTQLIESRYDVPAGEDSLCNWSLETTLELGGKYYWRVRGTDEYETGQWSDPAYFRTEPLYMCGDANSDESINVGDAVYIINYAFKGGPPPDPVIAGDANCDLSVNVGDAVYIINYSFKGGPVPCADCP
ncbi:MAG: hypothetical protein KAR42_03560 [candidate division Zixibacteria bacterium]|nr:hypothetical protein [candidate division Zixibacteria bacterium]